MIATLSFPEKKKDIPNILKDRDFWKKCKHSHAYRWLDGLLLVDYILEYPNHYPKIKYYYPKKH